VLNFSEIPDIVAGELLNLHHDQAINTLLIDSRQLSTAMGTLFFAIKGQRHDGHRYVEPLYQKGLRHFVIQKDHKLNLNDYPEANLVVVDHTITALQKLVAYYRQQLIEIPVLAITGSNAKTIIKEWLYQVLTAHQVIKSPKSYNSQVGVPLSVWQLHANAELGIFEAGISQPGEMQNLQRVI